MFPRKLGWSQALQGHLGHRPAQHVLELRPATFITVPARLSFSGESVSTTNWVTLMDNMLAHSQCQPHQKRKDFGVGLPPFRGEFLYQLCRERSSVCHLLNHSALLKVSQKTGSAWAVLILWPPEWSVVVVEKLSNTFGDVFRPSWDDPKFAELSTMLCPMPASALRPQVHMVWIDIYKHKILSI